MQHPQLRRGSPGWGHWLQKPAILNLFLSLDVRVPTTPLVSLPHPMLVVRSLGFVRLPTDAVFMTHLLAFAKRFRVG